MKVIINKHVTEVAPGTDTLGTLLATEGLDGPGRAVAVNNRVVRRPDWDATPLADGMVITVIKAVCGG